MQKVYLLLRNNQQTGPFNLEELIQFDLKPFDLIWIEGKSAGWYYPQEIKALHPHLPFVKPITQTPPITASPEVRPAGNVAAKKVFVSMPSSVNKEASVQQTTSTALPKQEFIQPSHNSPQSGDVKTAYTKTLEDVETDYTSWVYNQKTKKKQAVSKKGLLAACFIVAIAFAGWWAVKKFSTPADGKLQESANLSTAQNNLPADSSFQSLPQTVTIKSVVKKGKEIKAVLTTKTSGIIARTTSKPEQVSSAVVNSPSSNNEYETATATKEESKPVVEEKKPEPTAEAPKEKKKLRDKVLDIFRKKPDTKKEEEAKPVEEENGERKTARRESDASLTQLVSLHFTIPNDWMMGIKGAKATLTNKSNETVSASVEVLYYNDENELLDKRTVSFKNISAKSSQTVSVPDHAVATLLESKIVSVKGAGEPFAKL